MKKFTKQDLLEKLEFTKDEAKLIMDAQRNFPEVLTNDGEGFCVDGRKFHSQLKVEKAFTTWMNSNLEKVDAILNEDYTEQWIDEKGTPFKGIAENTSVGDLIGQGFKKEFVLTLDIAKEIAMTSGASNRANKNLKENSKLCRRYFILMEKAVKKMTKWNIIREPEKLEWNSMVNELKNWCERNNYELDDNIFKSFRVREANMLNQNLVGMTAQEIKSYLNYKDNVTRDHLNDKINNALCNLEQLNTNLLIANMDFETRKDLIKSICATKYNDLYIKK